MGEATHDRRCVLYRENYLAVHLRAVVHAEGTGTLQNSTYRVYPSIL